SRPWSKRTTRSSSRSAYGRGPLRPAFRRRSAPPMPPWWRRWARKPSGPDTAIESGLRPIQEKRPVTMWPGVFVCVWFGRLVRLDLCLDLFFGHALGEHLREIDGIDHQRREAAVAGGVGNDLAGEGEEQA